MNQMDNVDRIAQTALKGAKIDLAELGNVYAVAKECLRRGWNDDDALACAEAYVQKVARK